MARQGYIWCRCTQIGTFQIENYLSQKCFYPVLFYTTFGGTFKYGLTTFETPVATLITLLRLARGLWLKTKRRKLWLWSWSWLWLRFCCFLFRLFCCAFFFFVFGVCLASAYFGYFNMVVGVHLNSIVHYNYYIFHFHLK